MQQEAVLPRMNYKISYRAIHPMHDKVKGIQIQKSSHWTVGPHKNNNARDAIRTHEPLQEWILSPSELAGLSYPRTCNCILKLRSDLARPVVLTGHRYPNAFNYSPYN